MRAIYLVRLFCKKKLQNYKGKNDIVICLNDKQTTPDSSVYLWGDVITAGLRATRFVK